MADVAGVPFDLGCLLGWDQPAIALFARNGTLPHMQAIETPQLPGVKAGRITKQIMEAIADMVAEQMTETEACSQLGINPRVWFRHKERVKVKPEFDALLTRIRGAKLKGLLGEIKKAATGADGVRHDWRAADRLLAVTAPDRYAARAEALATASQPVISLDRFRELLSVARPDGATDHVIDCQPVKQIDDVKRVYSDSVPVWASDPGACTG